ncbi:hypothetical protein BJV82DRAFT_394896 [Fennellomyces sp. T-0311]|nr:hypothetical protein BJV82DRAFT_412120 [Fennellomyces sp. T-0311]KAI8146708.1 hypothetical protein BJV82DRAFT_394896 [Fennellomyces sp. T-0311]
MSSSFPSSQVLRTSIIIMPPKNIKKPSIKEDIAELQRQVKAVNEDVQLIYGMVNGMELTMKAMLEAQEKHYEEMKAMASEYFEKSRSAMTVDVTSASSSASENSHQRKIIPAPRITQEIDTEERSFSIRVVKDHILQYVIKAANDELTDSEAEALYQTMRGELNTALDALESRVKKEILGEMYEEDQYAYEDVAGVDESDVDMKGYTWGSKRLAKHRRIAIATFEAAVLEATGIDFSICEKHWASSHMLEETWNNRCKPKPTPANKRKPGKQSVEKDQLVQKRMRFVEDEGEDEEEDEGEDEEEEDEYEDEEYTKDDDE